MPDLRNDLRHGRGTDVARTRDHDAGQVRDVLARASQQAATVRHPAEQRDLAADHKLLDDLLQQRDASRHGADQEMDRAAVKSFERTQREQLEQRQQFELTAAAKLAAGSDDLAAARGLDAIRDHVARVNQQMTKDLGAMAEAMGSDLEGPNRRAALDEVLRDQSEEMDRLQESGARRLGLREANELDRQVREERAQTLNRGQLDAVNRRIGETLGVARLDDSAVQRIAGEARSRQRLADLDESTRLGTERAAVSRVKGQLFEELLERHVRDQLSSLNANRPADRQLEFIRGDQIRDDQNNKVTDGLLAWQDRNSGDLHVLQAFEAKAGHQAARELNRTLDELTLSGKEETRRYARDLARDELLGAQRQNETLNQYAVRQAEQLKNLSEGQRRRLEQRTKDHLEELLSRRVQTELGGQVQKTIERLHESTEAATRIHLDGKEARLAVDRGRTDVVKVVPQDVQTRDLDALRLPHRARDLQVAAEAIVDELRRRGII
jgi:hypothetical protein